MPGLGAGPEYPASPGDRPLASIAGSLPVAMPGLSDGPEYPASPGDRPLASIAGSFPVAMPGLGAGPAYPASPGDRPLASIAGSLLVAMPGCALGVVVLEPFAFTSGFTGAAGGEPWLALPSGWLSAAKARVAAATEMLNIAMLNISAAPNSTPHLLRTTIAQFLAFGRFPATEAKFLRRTATTITVRRKPACGEPALRAQLVYSVSCVT